MFSKRFNEEYDMNKAEKLLRIVDEWFYKSDRGDIFIHDILHTQGNPRICDILEDCDCEVTLPGNCYVVITLHGGKHYCDSLNSLRQLSPEVEYKDGNVTFLFYELENDIDI